jgi:PhzF family phenazine biosynthesis protein
MTAVRLLQIDAFADRAFSGNPAAVCLLPAARDADWMQSVAAEMNLSETAFVHARADGFELRWFTPKTEVELCGHATLASAHALWTTGLAEPGQPISFHTRSGILVCTQCSGLIEMDFPARPVQPTEPLDELADALGATPVYFGQSRHDRLVVLESEAVLRALQPDFRKLLGVAARAVIVTSPSDDSQFDFLSRFFAPGIGVDEDPVTGSAHCSLGPFWGERLGKADMTACQASSRGGIVKLRVRGDRVVLAGSAVTVVDGHLLADDPGSR